MARFVLDAKRIEVSRIAQPIQNHGEGIRNYGLVDDETCAQHRIQWGRCKFFPAPMREKRRAERQMKRIIDVRHEPISKLRESPFEILPAELRKPRGELEILKDSALGGDRFVFDSTTGHG